MAFNVSSAYTSSFHTPEEALDFDYAWAPNFSENLNEQELARKTAQTVLGQEKLEGIANREIVKEQYEQALKQKKWMRMSTFRARTSLFLLGFLLYNREGRKGIL